VRENPPLDYSFYTTCVEASGVEINQMRETARQISYETMLAHCRDLLDYAASLGYERRSTSGHRLTLKADFHVGYYKGHYGGCPCYYFVWSGIEHIWVKDGCEPYVEPDPSYRPMSLLARRNPQTASLFAETPAQDNPQDVRARCEEFHGDGGACDSHIDTKLWMPGPIVLIGTNVDCGYNVTDRRSIKAGRYVHDHKSGVKLYRRAENGERATKTLTPPRQVFVLGDWLGCTYDDGGEEHELTGSSRVKACTDNGKRLFAIHSTKGCLYVISGGSFRIRDWMYD